MKIAALSSLVCALALSLASCSDIVNHEPLFIYGVGVDEDAKSVTLHVLAASSEKGEKKDDGGEAGETEITEMSVVSFSGENAADAFGTFFASYEDVYSGTNKVYIIGDGVSDKTLSDIAVYLVNTPHLPLKRDIAFAYSAGDLLEGCSERFTAEQFSKFFEKDGVNALLYFALTENGGTPVKPRAYLESGEKLVISDGKDGVL